MRIRFKIFSGLSLFAFLLLFGVNSAETTVFFVESFDDTNYGARGWYDSTSPILDSNVKFSGNSSIRFTIQQGQNGPGASIGRRSFTPSDSVYVKFYIRFASGWQGFGTNSPHMVYVLTTASSAYSPLAWTKSTGYIEINGSAGNVHIPTLKLQDSENIDTNRINQNRCNYENRAVNGCNGQCDSTSPVYFSCYQSGNYWYNGRAWQSATSYASDTNWHKVEAYFKMNTVSGNIGQADGIIWMRWDDTLVIDKSNVIMRTHQNTTMQWNQIAIGPWGAASPTTQSFWIDELEVGTAPPLNGTPSPPTGLRIVSP